jgi:uncharacterized membrane-anchored protein
MKPIVAVLLIGCSLSLASRLALAEEGATTVQEDPARATLRKQFSELKWIRGPQQVQLFGNATLNVPADFIFLDPVETAKLQTLTHNVGGGTQYFLAPRDMHWEAIFSFSGDGYVKDDEKIDDAALLSSIRENTTAANKVRRERGWDEMEVSGWQTPPHYDSQSNRLEWAINGKDVNTNSAVVNFNTRILGRTGTTSAVLVANPDSLDSAIADFKSTLTGFSYAPGQRYAEYKSGDKVAQYGLAALVTGGAAAIAVKTGLWKVIVGAAIAGWKFIAAGAVAVFGGLARRFKRQNS